MMLLCVRKGMRSSMSGLKASDLSGFLRVTMPTVSQMVNVLCARGLLERTPDPLDRRIVRIKLTAEGELLTLETEAAMQRGIQELTEHLGAQRTQQLIDTLEDIYKYYTEGSPNTTPPSEARPNDKSSE